MAPLRSVDPGQEGGLARRRQAAEVGPKGAFPACLPTFDAIFHECAPFVWRVVQRLGVREADLDDVCQEVFLVVHRRLETYDGGSSVRTWVYGICLRIASDYRRRAHNRYEQPVDPLPDHGIAAVQDEAIEQQRALAWLDGVLET